MAWRDTYQIGSLDGAKFHTEQSEITPGRKIALYDTPHSDGTVTSIDLGKKPLRFVLDAIFVGEDYQKARDAFLKVVNKPGPKELVHPYYQRLYVIPVPEAPINVTENPNEFGGEARVKLTLVRHRAPATSATGAGLKIGTAAALTKAGLDLEDALSTDMEGLTSIDDFVASANLDVLDDVLGDLQQLNGDIDALLDAPGNLASQITNVTGELMELLSTPAKLFSAVDGLLNAMSNSFEQLTPDDKRASIGSTERVLSQMSALGAASEAEHVPEIDTETRRAQRADKAKILLDLRVAGIRRMTEAAAKNAPDNAAEARKIGRKVFATLTEAMEVQINGVEMSPAVRKATARYRTAAAAHLTAQAGRLIDLQTYTPPETLPAEVVAWTLYGDARRAEDVAARARAVHPGFIPGGVPIELLVS
jgi:prophage DNA circulation protein